MSILDLTRRMFRRAATRVNNRTTLAVLQLEDRTVPNGRPLPNPVIYMGAGDGNPIVKAFNAETGQLNFQRTVYDSPFHGGVRVATADFTGDGWPDVVTAPGHRSPRERG